MGPSQRDLKTWGFWLDSHLDPLDNKTCGKIVKTENFWLGKYVIYYMYKLYILEDPFLIQIHYMMIKL
jgi:hypothetical protein